MLTMEPGPDTGGKQSSGSAIDRAISPTGNFMKRTERKSAAGESRVHLGNPEGENRFRAPGLAFDPFDLRAQRLYGGLRPF